MIGNLTKQMKKVRTLITSVDVPLCHQDLGFGHRKKKVFYLLSLEITTWTDQLQKQVPVGSMH